MREVNGEVRKITWPSRAEVLRSARIVLATRAEVIYDIAAATGRGQKALIAKRERLARRAHLRAWRPYTLFERKVKPRRALFRPITPCDDVRRSIRFSGLDSTTILTVDMSRGLPSVDADSVLSDAQIVYASPGRLYVATLVARSDGRLSVTALR